MTCSHCDSATMERIRQVMLHRVCKLIPCQPMSYPIRIHHSVGVPDLGGPRPGWQRQTLILNRLMHLPQSENAVPGSRPDLRAGGRGKAGAAKGGAAAVGCWEVVQVWRVWPWATNPGSRWSPHSPSQFAHGQGKCAAKRGDARAHQ